MPWKIVKHDDGQWCVHKERPDGEPGEQVACHDSEDKAKAQLRALYANEGKSVTVKALTDDSAVVAGYGVVWGERDLEGDTFTPETDLDLEYVPAKRAYYDHRLDPDARDSLGVITEAKRDDVGLWVEAQLDRSRKYVDAVLDLVQHGALGWSSGSIAHLVERMGGTIKSWPIVEFSLTPTPAEPRTLGVRRLKALLEEHPSLKALVPEAAISEMAAADAGDAATKATDDVIPNGVSEMSDNNTPAVDPVDVAAIARQAADEAVKAYRAQLEAEPPVKGAILVPAEVKDPNDKGPYKSLGHFLHDVAKASTPGNATPDYLRAYKATGLNEGLSSQGGFLVQTDLVSGLFERMYTDGQIMSRVWRVPVSGNANGIKLNALAETSRANGSRWGGVVSYWASEGGTVTASKPAFRQMNLDLHKLFSLVYATDELLQDAAALESIVNRVVPAEIRFKTEDAIVRGNGTGQPKGILNDSGIYVQVSKESNQAADTVVLENIVKMYSRMWAPSLGSAVWFVNQDVYPQLFLMSMDVGTGGAPVFLPGGNISGAPFGTLMGRPIIPVEQCDTVGDLGDIIFADLSQYVLIEKGGIQAASSLHVMFLYDEQVWRFIYRVDGQPLWDSYLTPANSTSYVSPFIVLEAR